MNPLAKKPVSALMNREVATIACERTLRDAANLMLALRIGSLVVIRDTTPVGIITEREFVKEMRSGCQPGRLVEEAMASPLISIAPSATVLEAYDTLTRHGIRRLPVLEDGQLRGLISLRQIMNFSRDRLIGLIESNRILQKEASRDEMTGLFNRKTLQWRLKEEFGRSRRYGTRASLIFLDLDHFKKINDTFSHPAGDHVLRELGSLLKKTLRGSDLPARWGGEEFLVLAPNTKPSLAAALADKLRAAVAAHKFAFRGQTMPVTISAGVACLSTAGSAKEAVFRADQALYAAKARGRNRVCRWMEADGSIV